MPVTVSGRTAVLTPPAGANALIGDPTDWERRSPIPVQAGRPLRFELPRDSWFEFAWLDADGGAFADEEGTQKTLNPWYAYARAVQVGEWPEHPLWQGPVPELGEAHRLGWEGEVFAGKRRAIVYTPRGYAGEPLPIYYVQDGVAFYRIGKLAELLERARAAGQVQPAVLVFVEPSDRNTEYYLNANYLTFLQQEVIPRVEGELNDWGQPVRVREGERGPERGLWGASLGGLISLYAASELPALFSRVVSHSGAFIARPDATAEGAEDIGGIDVMTAGEWLRERLEQHPPQHLRVSLDTGLLEWLTAPNRRMAAAFAEAGIPHQYREYAGGHNWVTWRQAMPEALLYQLGEGLEAGEQLPHSSNP